MWLSVSDWNRKKWEIVAQKYGFDERHDFLILKPPWKMNLVTKKNIFEDITLAHFNKSLILCHISTTNKKNSLIE